MVNRIQAISALEILDSRGNPTLSVTVLLESGISGTALVPSGASTGAREAKELRDGGSRYGGRGVLHAIRNIKGEISHALKGVDVMDQQQIDEKLILFDGTPDKARFGANAIVGVSMAAARAAAVANNQPLYRSLSKTHVWLLPMPAMNVINGGKHADNNIDFQEFMIVPVGAPTFAEAMRYGCETYACLRRLLHERGLVVSVGDEGGFAPNLPNNEAACELIVEAIEAAGYRPGTDIAIALDPAASSFFSLDHYDLSKSGSGKVDRASLLAIYERWIGSYPIVSIEDGFDEADWQGFIDQTAAQGNRVQIVGDDLLVTNPAVIHEGVTRKAANAALIKLNQIGTVTETLEAIRVCRQAGWKMMISHRSGETIDSFISDFAVATRAGQIKAGAPCRGERLAKYNRLIEIENELGRHAEFMNPFRA